MILTAFPLARYSRVTWLEDGLALWPAIGKFFHIQLLLLDHKSCDWGRQPRGSSHLGQHVGHKQTQPACHKTNVFLFVTKNTTAIRTWSVLLWTAPAWLFWYFNKYQAQTRLGSSSLRNVSEGSAITHNKWAYANSGVFAMHKSLFGVLHSDAVCWYAIILKSIKVQVWVYRLTGAVGDALSSYRLPLEYSMNKEGKKIVTISGSLGVW